MGGAAKNLALHLFTKIMIKGFILFRIAVLHGHVAMKNGRFNMADKGKRAIF